MGGERGSTGFLTLLSSPLSSTTLALFCCSGLLESSEFQLLPIEVLNLDTQTAACRWMRRAQHANRSRLLSLGSLAASQALGWAQKAELETARCTHHPSPLKPKLEGVLSFFENVQN